MKCEKGGGDSTPCIWACSSSSSYRPDIFGRFFFVFFFKFLVERAVMIRKLEHDREKLSSQLERSQESASQAKKIARESEKAVKTERENAARLEVCF